MENMEILCRICICTNGTLDLDKNTFNSAGETVLLADAYRYFSKLNEHNTKNIILCDLCTENLITSFEFVKSLKKSEILYLEELNQKSINDTQEEEGTAEEEAYNVLYELSTPIQLNSENIIVYDDEKQTATELQEIEEEEGQVEEFFTNSEGYEITQSNPLHIRKPKSNIVLSGNVASMLKNAGIVTVARKRKAHKDVVDSPEKKHNSGAQIISKNPQTFIAIPQYIIMCDSPTDDFSTIDPIAPVVKILHVAAVRVEDENCLLNYDPDHVIDETGIPDENVSMYQCKYCQKAFATSHHLILHTRKSHLCQFCLEPFMKVKELHAHIKNDHSKFECPMCTKVFGCNSNLRAHIKRTHQIQLPANISFISVQEAEEVEC